MTDVASTTIQHTSCGAEVVAPGATMTGSYKVASFVSTIKQIAAPKRDRTSEKVSANRGNAKGRIRPLDLPLPQNLTGDYERSLIEALLVTQVG